ncbi:trypsin domain-containing protein [Ditylenchus destructor]|nr:trypsin domain-containing protein [Ditylenchus destructor]
MPIYIILIAALYLIILPLTNSSIIRSAPKCGQTPIKPRFLANQTSYSARPYSFPWAAAICHTPEYGGICYGVASVISQRWILGPYIGDPAKRFLLKIGFYDRSKSTEPGASIHRIKAIYNNPKFISAVDYFSSLIELEEPLEFSTHIQPVCLPLSDTDLLPRHGTTRNSWVVGWAVNELSNRTNKRLTQNFTRTDPNRVQQTEYAISFLPEISSGGLYSTTQHSFQNERGSSLLFKDNSTGRWFQYGILGWDFNLDFPLAEFSRVSIFCDWVTNTTAGEVNCI